MASDVLMKELDWSWKKKICSQIGARCDSVSSSMRSRRTWNGVELDCGNERRWTPMIDDRYVTDVTTRSDWKNGPCDAIESTPVEPRPMGGNNNNNNNMKKNKKKSPFFLVLSFQSLEDAGKHPVAIRRKGGVVANAEAIGGGASPFRWMPRSSRNEPDAGRRHLGAHGNGDLLGLDFLFAKENSVHSFVYGRVKKKMTITFFVAFFSGNGDLASRGQPAKGETKTVAIVFCSVVVRWFPLVGHVGSGRGDWRRCCCRSQSAMRFPKYGRTGFARRR